MPSSLRRRWRVLERASLRRLSAPHHRRNCSRELARSASLGGSPAGLIRVTAEFGPQFISAAADPRFLTDLQLIAS